MPTLPLSDIYSEEVASARYLGIVFDQRLSFDLHWMQESGNLRALMGSFNRLLCGQRDLFRLMIRTIAEGKIRHALPATPPTTRIRNQTPTALEF